MWQTRLNLSEQQLADALLLIIRQDHQTTNVKGAICHYTMNGSDDASISILHLQRRALREISVGLFQ